MNSVLNEAIISELLISKGIRLITKDLQRNTRVFPRTYETQIILFRPNFLRLNEKKQ